MKKRFLSLLIAIMVMVSVIPFSVGAEEISYPAKMDGVYIMNPADTDNTVSNYLPDYNHDIAIDKLNIIIKDGSVKASIYAYQKGSGTWDWCNLQANGPLQYDVSEDSYFVKETVDYWYVDGEVYHTFVFSWSEDSGLTMKSGGSYHADGTKRYETNNVNLPLIKVPVENFEGSYIGQIDNENETHIQLQSASMEVVNQQVNLSFTEYNTEYETNYNLFSDATFYYVEKNGRMAYQATHTCYTPYIEITLYLFEDDSSLLVEWRPVESFIAEVKNLKMIRQGKEPSEPQDYNVNIMGYGTSNTGEYMVNVVGNIQGTFEEGVNTLSNTDIQAQNLSINTFNLTNGASRVMGVSTVEGIQVTVTNGAVTNVEVKGRAQTNPGNFDRYTVNCNVF